MKETEHGLAGVLRVVYFLGLASLVITFVISAVTNVYEGPSDETVTDTVRSVFIDEEKQDYNRNLGIIFALVGSALSVAAVAGLRPHVNGIRAGVLFGGIIVLFAGIGYGGSGSSDWLVAVWSLLGVCTLGAVASYLDGGGDSLERLWGQVRPRPPAAGTPPGPATGV